MDTRDEESEITYIVPGLDSDQSESAVSRRVLTSPSVQAVVIDLATRASPCTVVGSMPPPSGP